MESLGIRQNEPNRAVSSLRTTLEEKERMVREVGASTDVTEDLGRMADSVGKLPIEPTNEDGWSGELTCTYHPAAASRGSGITFFEEGRREL